MKSSTIAVKGILWSAIERFSTQGALFVLSIILARIIAPHNFGLLAMLSIFIEIANTFVDSGFSKALVQKQDRTEKDFSTVFFFNIIISIIIYLVLFLTSPYIAAFYNEPILETLTKYVSINIIITSFAVVQRAQLVIRVDFKKQAKYSVIAVLISGLVGVILAYNNYGVWALVVQSLLYNLIDTLLYIFNVRWIPRSFFSVESFKCLFGFGSKLLFSGLLHTIYLNLYSIVIGKFYSATNVGYYNRANVLAQFPSLNLVQIMSRAIFPIQCQLQNEESRLQQSLLSYLRYSCFIVFPLMVGLASLSDPFIRLVLTDSWEGAILPLSILSISYMLYPIMHIDSQILVVKGKSDMFLKAESIKKVIAVAILCSTVYLGMIWLCLGIVIYNILDVIIIISFVKKVIHVTYMDHMRNLFPIFVASIVMGMVIHLFLTICGSYSYWLQLIVGFVIGVVSYYVTCKMLRIHEVSDLTRKINMYIHH
jgi:O-antigen/teichoic acid export membrane protein